MVTKSFAFNAEPGLALSVAQDVAKGFGWQQIASGNASVSFKTRASLRSWGENVQVSVEGSPSVAGGAIVTISSTPTSQWFDWGKSTKNIEQLSASLKTRLD